MITVKKTHVKIVFILLLALFFVLGFLLNTFLHTKSHQKNKNTEERIYDKKLQFINPLIECNEEQAVELRSFKSSTEKTIKELTQRGFVSEVSVYFRQMNDGLWFDINGYADFSPASLLKMPLMLAYLKQAEIDPKILNDSLTFTDDFNLYAKQNIKPEVVIENQKSYTVKDLIGRMIVYSDNSAQAILMNNAGTFWQKPYIDLGIELPGNEGKENFMSVIEYARFFRVLYNASYLNKYYSNLALGILAESRFKEGLDFGIPEDIAVAHKFGEREVEGKKQLHDCGIIYHPDSPYLLCIMTRGNDFESLKKSIQTISKEVFEEVDSQSKK